MNVHNVFLQDRVPCVTAVQSHARRADGGSGKQKGGCLEHTHSPSSASGCLQLSSDAKNVVQLSKEIIFH